MVFEVEAPTEGILSQEKDAELFLNRESVGRGDFYVTERDVIFIGPQRKLRLEYNTISVHAISKDNSNFPNQHCIFMIVNEQDVQHVDEPEIRYFNSNDQTTNDSSEYHLVPSESNLDGLYDALCEGQSLNPDDMEEDQGGASAPIDLSGFTWAPGYGPDSLLSGGGPMVGAAGDATNAMAGLDVSLTSEIRLH